MYLLLNYDFNLDAIIGKDYDVRSECSFADICRNVDRRMLGYKLCIQEEKR